MTIERVTESNRSAAERYLATHEDSSQFLINNLRQHGPDLSSHPNSGNFKLIRRDGGIVAVFCLTRRGTLLVQSDDDCAEPILRACQDEELQLKGFVGSWTSVSPVWQRFTKTHPLYRSAFESREILYSRELRLDDPHLTHDPRVRLLESSDVDQWLAHIVRYISELSVPDDTTLEHKRAGFAAAVGTRSVWGLFSEGILLSRAALNSQGTTVGQTGAVFTLHDYRRRGLAKTTMLHMLRDCRDLHGHRKSILFTGESNLAARKLYESIGYARIGSFCSQAGLE